MSDTNTLVVLCVGAAVVGACIVLSLAAAVVDRVWRRCCMPRDYQSAAAQLAAQEAERAAPAVEAPTADAAVPADAHVPYLICVVCGAAALYPDDIGGADPPPFFWDAADAWPPPAPRPRSRTH